MGTNMVRKTSKRQSERPATAGFGARGPPVTYKGNLIGGNNTTSITIKGQDQLAFIADTSNFEDGDVIVEEVITCQSFKRLAELAGSYQRVKWNKLQFKVQSQLPTATSGGYIAAFVADPDDVIGGSPSQRAELMSNKNAIAAKAYDMVKLDANVKGRSLFTSQTGESRLYSPGLFAMVLNGVISAHGSMMIWVDWDVTLSIPTAHSPAQLLPGLRILAPFAGLAAGRTGLWAKDAAGDTLFSDPVFNLRALIGEEAFENFQGQSAFFLPPAGRAWVGDDDETYEGNIVGLDMKSSQTMGLYLIENFNGAVNIKAKNDHCIFVRGSEFVPTSVEDFQVGSVLRRLTALPSRSLTKPPMYSRR